MHCRHFHVHAGSKIRANKPSFHSTLYFQCLPDTMSSFPLPSSGERTPLLGPQSAMSSKTLLEVRAWLGVAHSRPKCIP